MVEFSLSEMDMTMTAGAPTPTSTSGMDHGMDGMGMGDGCKISMLWNWNVLDACFISPSWRITSKGMFAGSCIGVVLLVMSLEFLRRVSHEFDHHVAGRPSLFDVFGPAKSQVTQVRESENSNESLPKTPACSASGPGRRLVTRRRSPTLLQHTLRSLLHMVQFGVAYFVMLLAMYYNGYFIICILIGAFVGSFVFSWKSQAKSDACEVTVCCG